MEAESRLPRSEVAPAAGDGDIVDRVLRACRGDKAVAAKVLGIDISVLG